MGVGVSTLGDAYFEPLGGGGYLPTDAVRGPWTPDAMHGGPPAALLAHEMLDAVAGVAADRAGLLARFTLEILRPVPVAEVHVAARVERPGSRVMLLSAQMRAGGEPVALARAWWLRTDTVSVPECEAMAAPPGPGSAGALSRFWGGGYIDSVEWSWVAGGLTELGPGTVWARPRHGLVPELPLRPEERVLLVADSGSGVSAAADPAHLVFLNTELTVHLHRPTVGEWLWLDAVTTLDPCGIGLAAAVIGDGRGSVGRGEQCLFIAPTR